jgi:predicted O-methyltransferase YrrM
MLKSVYRFFSSKFQTVFLDYPVDLKPRYGYGKAAHPELMAIIDANRSHYKQFLMDSLKFQDQISEIKSLAEENDVNQPTWNNGMLPGLDIIALYSMLAIKRPGKYIEIGSGNSTKVAYKSKRDNDLSTEIISIDPLPRAEIDQLADVIIRKPFENIDHNVILNLEPGDILFIDNSHRILPNSDAMVFFMEILPRLKKGVIVQIHDIYLPYDYPQFMCERAYSEQYGLAIYLLANPSKFSSILPNYFISKDSELNRVLQPIWKSNNLQGVEQHGGSFWLEIN